MIEKMTKFNFILLSEDVLPFLNHMQEMGLLDITRSTKPIDDKARGFLSEAEELKHLISWIENEDFCQDSIYNDINSSLCEARSDYERDCHWGEFDPKTLDAIENAGQKITFYTCSSKRFDPSWKDKILLYVIKEEDGRIWFVTVGDSGQNIPLDPCCRPERSVSQQKALIASLEEKLRIRADELRERKEEIPSLRGAYRAKLARLERYQAADTISSVGEDRIKIVSGFTPSADAEALCQALDKMEIFYYTEDARVEDNPPIKLKNNRFVRMFELLTDMYGRPAYNGFDPTPYISVFFLLFFAMCMGDAGYGIVLAIAGLFLGKSGSFKKLSPLVVTLGIGTFIVGFLFHTFFSLDISTWECIPNDLKACMVPSKVSTYDGTMILALIIGIIHLCLAMVVKTVYATRNKGFLGSLGIWGWTVLIVGGVVIAGVSLMGVIDERTTKIVVITLGILSATGIFLLNDLHRNPLLNIGSGLWEAYNTATGLLGDVLSYLRLYALGLAGGMLGYAFNDLAQMALGDGGARWIAFVLIVVIGHTLNLAMAVLGAFVHPLRLNFLEFFKNSGYEGTGRNYNPLSKNK